MIVLGLTGSIGMGKTTLSRMLSRLGCAVHNSDEIVHYALSPKGEAFEEVALTFPESWDKKNHLIQRDILGKIIFDNPQKRKQLEEILHPIVRQNQKKFIQKQKRLGREFVVLDIPLLFETGAENRVDYTIVATAPYHIQRQRVLHRQGMSEEKFQAILKSQLSDVEKQKRADFVVSTGMGMAYSFRTLKNILQEIK
ncbi:MAG: dephospho-CoA kinase [Alphaproteobacteria bacterium]|nr:dephospho-CoA kinase [Alphaproteobacteria bacterium]